MFAGGAAYPVRTASVACLLAGGALTLGGCSKEAALRDRLGGVFFALGDTLYHEQKLRCHAAVFRATDDVVSEALTVHSDPPYEAQATYRISGLAAVRNDTVPPRDLAEVMLLSGGDGALGKQALAAAALVGNCWMRTLRDAFGGRWRGGRGGTCWATTASWAARSCWIARSGS